MAESRALLAHRHEHHSVWNKILQDRKFRSICAGWILLGCCVALGVGDSWADGCCYSWATEIEGTSRILQGPRVFAVGKSGSQRNLG